MANEIPKLKTDGRYKDAPRFPLIYKYEGRMKKSYAVNMVEMTKSVALKMLSFEKEL